MYDRWRLANRTVLGDIGVGNNEPFAAPVIYTGACAVTEFGGSDEEN